MALNQYHDHDLLPHQCSSTIVETIDAPLSLVWSMIRNFNRPQAYKSFVRSCTMIRGDGDVGSVRKLKICTGLPAKSSTERLDKLDDDLHVIQFSVIGGKHRLANYHSTTSVHQDEQDNGGKTVVIESYVVDTPPGNTKVETCTFTDTIIRCNLRNLAAKAEMMADEA